jgi:predicted HTH transcriptional regulator
MFGRLESASGDADAAVVDHIKEEFLAISEKDEGTRKFFMAQRRMMILRMLKEDPKTTIEKLMHKLNCSARTIKRDIIVLENIDFLRRVGGRSDSGHWKVMVASLPRVKS